ncbi:MAG: calcium-translocating P-type ATPase, SERCA-type [Candidatus Odinarchaeia archaeon]
MSNNEIKWHAIPLEDTLNSLGTSLNGLSKIEAKERLLKYGLNELKKEKKISPFKIFLNQFGNFLVIILIFAAAISWALALLGEGDLIDGIVILIVVFVNAILGFVQEYKAEKSLEALKELTTPKARVIRDGKELEMPAPHIVPGDIVIIEAGDKVPADIRLIEVYNLKVDESSLTGESVPVTKSTEILPESTPLADRVNMAFMGSIVTYGRAKGVVVATGMKTEIGKIAKMVQEEDKQTPLQIKLDQLGKRLGIIILGLCGIVFIAGILRNSPIFEMFLIAVSLAVAAIPEGLPAIVTMGLALGVQRMAKRNAIIRKLPAVETLGASTIICSDKTGTLTQNAMTVRTIYCNGEEIEVTGSGFTPSGEFYKNKSKIDPLKDEALTTLLKAALLSSNSSLEYDPNKKQWYVTGDPTSGALVVAAVKAGLRQEDLLSSYKKLAELPFDSERKRVSVVCKTPEGRIEVYTAGAPEIIINLCSSILKDGKITPLTSELKKDLLDKIGEIASKAMRVIGVAFKVLPGGERDFNVEKIERDLVFLGLLGMMDPPREEAKDAIKIAREAGIRPIMITGDNKNTAAAIARELGLLGDGDLILTGEELDKMSIEELEKIIDKVAVFARVSPKHKLQIVKALKGKSQVVAMTGDGVNDAPALKSSDIGVAMGITGTEVSKESADMVLADDNFATIVSAIEEGRRIYDNIAKVVRYLISTNFGEIITLFVGIIIGLPAPVTALQILWINLVTDSLPAIALGIEPPELDIMKRRPRDPKENILSKKILMKAILLGSIMCVGTLSLFWLFLSSANYWALIGTPAAQNILTEARTIAFTALTMFQMWSVLAFRSEKHPIFRLGLFTNIYLIGAIIISISLQALVIYLPPLQLAFETVGLTVFEWISIVLVSSSIFIAMELSKILMPRLKKRKVLH